MHSITFFPIGNADCSRIDLENGMKLLFDFAHFGVAEDDLDPRIDLASALRRDLKESGKDEFDVVAFTHGDDDHVHGASEFFYLEHASKYQGESRIKIKELWVPAALVLEEKLNGDARVLRQEARHRLKTGKGIRVFSRPERLKNWLEDNGLSIEQRKHLITDAGKIVPGFSLASDGVEFFVHSPFAERGEDGELADRNEASLILQATLLNGDKETRAMLCGDVTCDVLSEIVDITRYHKNDIRLAWDIFNIPHHCSHNALNPEKGKEITRPIPNVKWLFNQGNNRALLVSSSKPIPSDDADPQPPHRQAANYYRNVAETIDGEFVVTMEHPNEEKPEPLRIEIDSFGARRKKVIAASSVAIVSRPAPRAG
ncbi:MAG: hypothetical protein ACM3UZ_15635 [Acidobacteriota bacterium]